jgi:hypothetical protein
MLAKYLDFETLFLNTNILTITTIAKPPHNNTQYNCCREMRLCVYNMIDEGRRGRKPGYIHEMGSHDIKSCEVKCQRNNNGILTNNDIAVSPTIFLPQFNDNLHITIIVSIYSPKFFFV